MVISVPPRSDPDAGEVPDISIKYAKSMSPIESPMFCFLTTIL